jgi:hypothetical protein
MAETVEEITIEWTDDDGQKTVKELDKEILTKGAWSTVMFKYQELNKKSGEYGPVKFRIGRYQKRNGVYYPHSKFNISSIEQAQKIIGILQNWMEEAK